MDRANAICWFDLCVEDMDRASAFYEAVFQQRLEPIGDPNGEAVMRGFPANMSAHGASGALVKSPHARPGPGGAMVCSSVDDLWNKHGWRRLAEESRAPSSPLASSVG